MALAKKIQQPIEVVSVPTNSSNPVLIPLVSLLSNCHFSWPLLSQERDREEDAAESIGHP